MSPSPTSPPSIPLNERLILALDVDTADEAKQWVERLQDQIRFFKVGLQLFGPGLFPLIEWMVQHDLKVMLDMKFFDVPRTVGAAMKQLHHLGISYATVHGNGEILKAAVDEKHGVKVFAVTVLTSLDETDIHEMGFPCSPEQLVMHRARKAVDVGCDGLVSSGHEVPSIRQEFGSGILTVVPGVRPAETKDDQKRTVNVQTAFRNGADHIVVGRPIRAAADPVETVAAMLRDIEGAVGN